MRITSQSRQHGMERTASSELYQEIVDSWLPIAYILEVVFTCRAKTGPNYWVWQNVASTQEEARAYYSGLDDPDEKRSEAASAAASAGWNVRDIAMRKA